jgi:pimeloyl-ACP methyl ester carboxylesterase
MTTHQLILPTGSVLAYDLYGDPAGLPCFYFHGWPSSRVQGALMDDVGREFGLCVCAMDRPGIGDSEAVPGRVLGDWPRVMSALADHLGWDRAHCIGVSGGGPYVLAMAALLPDRMRSATVVCGAPPLYCYGTGELYWPYRLVLAIKRACPALLDPFFRMAYVFSDSALIRVLIAALGEQDRLALSDPRVFEVIGASFRASLRSGVAALQADGDVYLADWGFDLASIAMPVHVWHGTADRNIPLSYVQRLCNEIPAAERHWVPGAGHYSLPVLNARQITATALGIPMHG